MAQDALSVLLNLKSPAHVTPGAPGGIPTYTPNISRNNAKTALLAKFLGIQDTGSISQQDMESAFNDVIEQQAAQAEREAAAQTMPERVKGEYGLAGERIKGQSALETARMNREAAASERATAREFQAQQGALNREAIGQRQATTATNVEQRRQATRESIAQGQTRAQNEARAKRLLAPSASMGRENAPRPPNEGLWGWLTGPSQETLNQQEAARLRQQSPQQPAFEDASDDELALMILQKTPDATEDEIAQWISEIRGGR